MRWPPENDFITVLNVFIDISGDCLKDVDRSTELLFLPFNRIGSRHSQ